MNDKLFNLDDLEELQKRIDYKFKDLNYLKVALTHSSFGNEHNIKYNERLEFLGDAVLELSVSKVLFNIDKHQEGVLTKKRAQAVCEDALNYYAEKIELNKFLYLGKGEEVSQGRYKPAIIADAFEALLGAVFMDGGMDAADKYIEKLVLPYLNNMFESKDYKSILQEKLQSEKRTIRYEITNEYGPSNDKTFEAVVYMDDILMGSGIGRSKKEAQQMAAKAALKKEAKFKL